MERKSMYRAPLSSASVARKLVEKNPLESMNQNISIENHKLDSSVNSRSKTRSSVEKSKTQNLQQEMKIELSSSSNRSIASSEDKKISQERLQEAIIWSEILGKPVCKRKRSRFH